MPKPSVYVSQPVADALAEMYPETSLSALIACGLIHVIARGPQVIPSDRLRAAIAIEAHRDIPNRDLMRAAEHALRTRKAQAFCERYLPGGRVAF